MYVYVYVICVYIYIWYTCDITYTCFHLLSDNSRITELDTWSRVTWGNCWIKLRLILKAFPVPLCSTGRQKWWWEHIGLRLCSDLAPVPKEPQSLTQTPHTCPDRRGMKGRRQHWKRWWVLHLGWRQDSLEYGSWPGRWEGNGIPAQRHHQEPITQRTKCGHVLNIPSTSHDKVQSQSKDFLTLVPVCPPLPASPLALLTDFLENPMSLLCVGSCMYCMLSQSSLFH